MTIPMIADIELDRTNRIETILDAALKAGLTVHQYVSPNQALPYHSCCNGFIGRGDSRREADAQLAQKLSFAAPSHESD